MYYLTGRFQLFMMQMQRNILKDLCISKLFEWSNFIHNFEMFNIKVNRLECFHTKQTRKNCYNHAILNS